MKILIADDDATLRTELAGLLQSDGHSTTTAEDGLEALRMLEAESYDVALVDLKMPKATGLEILHRLQVLERPTSVVMITGFGSIDVAVEAMKAGAVDFVVKPFEFDALQRILAAIEDERKAKRMLAVPAQGPDAFKSVLEDAARRKALLAFLGPNARPPKGASRVIRIDETGRPPDVFTPAQLYQINAAIELHVAGVDFPVVYAADLGMLEELHGRADLRSWVRHVSQRCAENGGSLVLIGLDRALVSEIENESDVATVDAGLQGMLESVANPIRRAIVSYVYGSGPVSYSSILKMNFVDSSSKLSFHLQKLLADALLAKTQAGAYVLTEEGRRSWRVVRALGDERRKPAILFGP